MEHAPDSPVVPYAAPLDARLARLERRLSRAQLVASFACCGLAAALTLSLGGAHRQIDEVGHLRVRRLDVVDDAGVVRLSMGQDPEDTQRRSRSAGMTVHDTTGAERGGFGTFDDGSVVFAMDAPHGVGDPMPDRLALFVGADGSSHVMLLDNRTRAVTKLHSDGAGGGGVQVFKWDMEKKEIHVKTETYDGDVRETLEMGG